MATQSWAPACEVCGADFIQSRRKWWRGALTEDGLPAVRPPLCMRCANLPVEKALQLRAKTEAANQ